MVIRACWLARISVRVDMRACAWMLATTPLPLPLASPLAKALRGLHLGFVVVRYFEVYSV